MSKKDDNPPNLGGYKMLNKIGSGSFSTVYKAKSETIPNHLQVAIKCIDKTKYSDKLFDNIVNEIKVLKMLHHENIVNMLDFQWDQRYVYIILEYCDGGDLSKFIKKKEKLSEYLCQKFVRQLCLALKFLRDHNVCHLDLKPQNILIKKNTLKLGDFGFAQILTQDDLPSSKKGSPLYMAPEILIGDAYDGKADLWSLGIIVYECLFGQAPYSKCSFQELRDQAFSPVPLNIPKTPNLSDDCRDFLTKLLQKDPKLRIDHEGVFKHSFPDLEHAPSTSSYNRGVELVQKAVKNDSEGNLKVAFNLYCEALNFLIPLAQDETNMEKKKELQKKIEEYTRRAEDLRSVVVCDIKRSSLRNNPSMSPKLNAGLEIGESGEMYMAEGRYEIALEKFKSSLNILIPLCEVEHSPPMKSLLTQQIQDWLEKAEYAQTILDASQLEMNELEATAVTSRCVIQ